MLHATPNKLKRLLGGGTSGRPIQELAPEATMLMLWGESRSNVSSRRSRCRITLSDYGKS